MHCEHMNLPDGGHAIVCGPKKATKKCSVCGRGSREYRLCDFPMQGGKTCDRILCPSCATHQKPNVDYCPTHAALFTPEGRLKL